MKYWYEFNNGMYDLNKVVALEKFGEDVIQIDLEKNRNYLKYDSKESRDLEWDYLKDCVMKIESKGRSKMKVIYEEFIATIFIASASIFLLTLAYRMYW
jgi:hypothetical protein